MFPILIENSLFAKIINLESITIGPITFFKSKASQSRVRYEMIRYTQQKETLYIGYFFILLFDLFYNIFILNIGLKKESYYNTRFYKELEDNYDNKVYLAYRKKFAWIDYKLSDYS